MRIVTLAFFLAGTAALADSSVSDGNKTPPEPVKPTPIGKQRAPEEGKMRSEPDEVGKTRQPHKVGKIREPVKVGKHRAPDDKKPDAPPDASPEVGTTRRVSPPTVGTEQQADPPPPKAKPDYGPAPRN